MNPNPLEPQKESTATTDTPSNPQPPQFPPVVTDQNQPLGSQPLQNKPLALDAFPHIEENATQTIMQPVPTKKRFGKKPLLIAIAAVVVVLGAGGAVFGLVYNKPENVVADSMMKSIVARSSTSTMQVSYKGKGSSEANINVSATIMQNESDQSSVIGKLSTAVDGKSYSVSFDGVTDKDQTVYVKVSELKSLLDTLSKDNPFMESLMEVYQPIIAAVDNKWISISESDLKKLTGEETEDKQTKCLVEKIKAFQTDKPQQKQIRDLYDKNQFIIVKSAGTETVSGVYANKYTLTGDDAKAKSFLKGLKDTTAFKSIDDCVDEDLAKNVDEELNNNSDVDKETQDDTTTTVEYWVGFWSHEPVKARAVSSNNEGTLTIEVTTKLGTNPAVTIPKADKSILDLQKEIEEATSALYGDYSEYTVPEQPAI
jgi:hypothetical protein